MYPLCWAVVEGETNASWAWFFAESGKVLDDTDGTNMTLIFNEAQAIINGVASVFPKAKHRHYARHVLAHWHSVFKGDDMKPLFWKAAKAYNQADYKDSLADME
ncbi:Bifunctional glutamine synthetase adenylyltransferase/adenylyl-removing enzyme, partial [Bienertia sinuspersici]